ncbi:MAG: redoxin family protein [Pyrinomonadaceae bacterium]
MPKTVTQKVEFLANIAIIVVALLLGFVLVKNYLLPDRDKGGPPNMQVPVGSKVSLPGVDWAGHNQTLLVVLQKGCRYCSESAPFYQRLVKETDGRNLHLVAVLPQTTDESKQYLNELGVPIADIKQATLDSLGVGGTPTLILVDNQGVVKNAWVGKLNADNEAGVLRQLQGNAVASR